MCKGLKNGKAANCDLFVNRRHHCNPRLLQQRGMIGGTRRANRPCTGRGASIAPQINSASRWRFRPLLRLTFRLPPTRPPVEPRPNLAPCSLQGGSYGHAAGTSRELDAPCPQIAYFPFATACFADRVGRSRGDFRWFARAGVTKRDGPRRTRNLCSDPAGRKCEPTWKFTQRAGKGTMERLAGRHIVVTGGGKGIGTAIAERFAAEGATLSLGSARGHCRNGRVAPLRGRPRRHGTGDRPERRRLGRVTGSRVDGRAFSSP